MKKQSPLRASLNRTFSYIVLLLESSSYGLPMSLCDKTNYLPQELFWALLSRGQKKWQTSYATKQIILCLWPRMCTTLISQSQATSLLVFISSALSFPDIRKHFLMCISALFSSAVLNAFQQEGLE